MIHKRCLTCGITFHLRDRAQNRDQKHCSRSCSKKQEKELKRNCDYCGDVFYKPERECYSDTEEKIYCSNICRRNAKRKRQRENLSNRYVKRLINLPSEDIPQELIELKRLNIKRKRIIKTNK